MRKKLKIIKKKGIGSEFSDKFCCFNVFNSAKNQSTATRGAACACERVLECKLRLRADFSVGCSACIYKVRDGSMILPF